MKRFKIKSEGTVWAFVLQLFTTVFYGILMIYLLLIALPDIRMSLWGQEHQVGKLPPSESDSRY